MRLLRWLAIALLVLALAAVALGVAARFGDGPLGPLPGGPLETGELVTDPEVDWSFARDVKEVELQLVDPPRSRLTWIIVHEGHAYVPCAIGSPPFKRWHREALRDGRAVLRVAGKRYERQAVRVIDPDLFAALGARVQQKYGGGPSDPTDPRVTWFFRLDPRPGG